MNGTFLSGGLSLARYLVQPTGKTGALPAMVLCHGFPSGGIDARHSAGTFSELCDRVANELGWTAMTFTFRGCATSEGDFSMQGWIDDLRAVCVDQQCVAVILGFGSKGCSHIATCTGPVFNKNRLAPLF